MNKTKLNKVIGDGNIVIPLYILKYFKKLDIEMEEFVFLMYLYNKQDNLDFNPEKISQDLNIDIMEVMGYVSVLSDKGYLNLEVKENENKILEEVINLNNFYERISMFLINNDEIKGQGEEENNLIVFIERELGRPLSSIDIETIYRWKEQSNEDLIKEALRIALSDGVYSLKYIDKILNDWESRGYHSLKDLETKKIEKNENLNENNNMVEVSDWDWLEDEEEYIIN